MTYLYKGQNVSELLTLGGTSYLAGYYDGFPNYISSEYYTTDRPLDIGYKIQGTPVSNYVPPSVNFDLGSMVAKYTDFTTLDPSSTTIVPLWANRIRIIAIGAGGGQGGQGGNGTKIGPANTNGGNGGGGALGNYVAYTGNDINGVAGSTITMNIGKVGNRGSDGPDKPSNQIGSGGDGSPGAPGGSTTVTIGNISFRAGGGGGGVGGGAGNANNNNPPTNQNLAPVSNSNPETLPVLAITSYAYTDPPQQSPPNTYNPAGYAVIHGTAANTTTGNGLVRIYFLKE